MSGVTGAKGNAGSFVAFRLAGAVDAGGALFLGSVALHAAVLGLDGDVAEPQAGAGTVAVAARHAAL
jgi:hypothetical protein